MYSKKLWTNIPVFWYLWSSNYTNCRSRVDSHSNLQTIVWLAWNFEHYECAKDIQCHRFDFISMSVSYKRKNLYFCHFGPYSCEILFRSCVKAFSRQIFVRCSYLPFLFDIREMTMNLFVNSSISLTLYFSIAESKLARIRLTHSRNYSN